jgi:uncharacterized delta-60 repeat protein
MRQILTHLWPLCALSLSVAFSLSAYASPPVSLDPTFGTGGILRVPAIVPVDAALQPDGKLLVAGPTNPSPGAFVVSRFNRDGSVDMGFGIAGVLRPQVNGFPFRATVLFVLKDGRFLISGGTQQQCGPNICGVSAIARLSADGDVDLSFGNGGIAALAHLALKLVLRPDGSIIALEDSSINCGLFCIIRRTSIEALTADGTLIASWPNPCQDGLEDLVVQPDGKTVVTVLEGDSVKNLEQCIARFSFDGTLDPSFGTNGIRHVPHTSGGLPILLIDPRDPLGRIVTSTGNGAFGVLPPGSMVRLLANGDNDPAFGDPRNDHIATTSATLLTLGCANKIIGAYAIDVFVSGTPLLVPAGIHLLRYNSNGMPDSTFAGEESGEIFTMLNDLNQVKLAAIRDDGEVIIVGSVEPPLVPASLFVAAYRQPDCMHPNDLRASPVIEYYNASLDHYFITSFVDDMNALDSGHFAGWTRTGYTFNAGSGIPGLSAVCRFYIPPPYGDSHFFSASPDECAEVATRFPAFVLETPSAMKVGLPESVTGVCAPSTSMPVYRVWDQRLDTNHRYTTDRDVRNAMVAKGWIAEGYGPDAVAMCALPQ